jgi:hypothetical protein
MVFDDEYGFLNFLLDCQKAHHQPSASALAKQVPASGCCPKGSFAFRQSRGFPSGNFGA